VAIYFNKWRDMMYVAGGRSLPGRLLEIRSEDAQKPKKGCCSNPKSYGVFEESGWIRSTCKRISSALWFDILTILMILLGCVGLSFDAEQRAGHRNKRHRGDSAAVDIVEGFVVHFFVIEFFIRTIADGEITYLWASRLNSLDAFSTWCSTLSYYDAFAAIEAMGGVSDELSLVKVRLWLGFPRMGKVQLARASPDLPIQLHLSLLSHPSHSCPSRSCGWCGWCAPLGCSIGANPFAT